jgi:hypothetical protein
MFAGPPVVSLYPIEQPQTDITHCPPNGVNDPVGLDVVKITGPLGAMPRITALHVVVEFAGTGDGRQNADMTV